MRQPPPEMTAAEFALMKALWQLERGTVADIRERHSELSGNELAYTTVMTLLGRLAAKGAVSVDRSRQPYHYEPSFREESVLRQRLRRFLDTVFDGRAEALVLQLVADESLSAEELQRIREFLEERDEEESSS